MAFATEVEMRHGFELESESCTGSSHFICGAVEGFYGRPWSSEQRKDLFEKFDCFGLNTYLYAPKDDVKHRFEWRALYNIEESELLRSLIESAILNNVTFVYSLSPGIDIVYSDPAEVEAIENKLGQVRQMGCTAFALLFDDIESSMNEKDSAKYPSFVDAQLDVANQVFTHMGQPLFFFCPTEYCSSRCVPSLEESDYLRTLGEKLHIDIHIMWTGPQVVSPQLTPEHAEQVASVIKRKPLIWDNLHANDYDPKRVFLGPFKGRSVALKNSISGMLLNPNCKYEANFVPFYTLAVWNRSTRDEESRSNVGITYRPHEALYNALEKWKDLYWLGPGPAIPPISHVESTIAPVMDPNQLSPSIVIPPPTIRTCEGNDLIPDPSDVSSPIYTSPTGNATTVTVQAFPLNDTTVGVVDAPESALCINSLLNDYSETVPDQTKKPIAMESLSEYEAMDQDSVEDMETYSRKIDCPQLALLVDLFYLPFDYGEKGVILLENFQWIHSHAYQLANSSLDEVSMVEFNSRFDYFITFQNQLEGLFRVFLTAPNRSIVQEIFPYLSEAYAITTVLAALLRWMKNGSLSVEPINMESWWLDRRADVEPWSFGNGILSDLQKLIISSGEVADLLVYKNPIPLPISSYITLPVVHNELDLQKVYEYFSTPFERELLSQMAPNAATDIFFDRTFAFHFKYGIPPHHFLLNDIDPNGRTTLFALLTAIISMPAVIEALKTEYVSEYKDKYRDMFGRDQESLQRELMFEQDVESWPIFKLPAGFLAQFPSFFEVRWREFVPEAAWVRRLIHCAIASLAMNGSTGIFTIVPSNNEALVQIFSRFGLHQIESVHLEDHIVFGHLL